MVSGTGDERPILTIAIPTWNRAGTLTNALKHLLPQVSYFRAKIEIVISDNGSTDNTWEVITEAIAQHQSVKIIANRQAQNTGFFENLKKCRELGSGRYLWVLSDDDFVTDGLLNVIMENLGSNNLIATLFLKNAAKKIGFNVYRSNRDRLLIEENYHIGLISSVIFLNEKQNDHEIYSRYHGNAFLGFLLLLSAFTNNHEVVIVEGNCLTAANASSKGINFFDIFINHMEGVIDFMRHLTVPESIITKFRCSYLVYFIRRYYILFKAEKSLKVGNFEHSPLKDIEDWVHKSYSHLKCYWVHFYVVTFVPGYVLNIALKTRRLLKNS
ncbi:MAG: glycosyltransferase family 2 protein [Ferruginibacter sp.]|nr:glycosyltransferase family 2 protein [Ferruginibacter sp.]